MSAKLFLLMRIYLLTVFLFVIAVAFMGHRASVIKSNFQEKKYKVKKSNYKSFEESLLLLGKQSASSKMLIWTWTKAKPDDELYR